MRLLDRGSRSPTPDTQGGRDQSARTLELRRALRTGSILVGATLLVAGFSFALRYPDRAVPFLMLWTSGAAASSTLFLAARRAPHALVLPMTVVLTVIPAILILGTAMEARALLAVTSGFTMLPVAVPLFLAWTRSVRNGWLLLYTVVFAGITIATGFGHLDSVKRLDLASDVVIGSFIGWIGGELLERMRERTRAQEAELRRLNSELQVRATTDALTGLSNRRQLDTDLQILSTARLGGAGSCAFIMLDLDRFKRLNDELGHAAGDEALRAVSAELHRVIRSRDSIYRYGGEEFLVVMPDSSLEVAAAAAERIRAGVAGVQIQAGTDPAKTLTISGGVAFSLSAREHWEAVLAAADAALYQAKAAGRNQIVVAPAVVHELPAGITRDRRRPLEPVPTESSAHETPVDRAG
ncbi:MAG: GGDEF domain-containing protein [Candidatus Limnocylindrales bacterium]